MNIVEQPTQSKKHGKSGAGDTSRGEQERRERRGEEVNIKQEGPVRGKLI